MNRIAQFKKIVIAVITVIFLGISCVTQQESPKSQIINGTKASYGTTIKYVPSNLPGGSVPLVVAIHGCSQSAADYKNSTGWNEIADKMGFIVMYPHKTSGSIMNCWNHANTSTGDPTADMNYIIGEINKVKSANNIDDERIFVTGLSSGGGMTYCLMEHHGDIFAGAAPMAAPICKNKPGNPQNEIMLIWHSSIDYYSGGDAGFSRYGGRYTGASKTIINGELKEGNSQHSYDAYTKDGKAVVGMVSLNSMSHGISVDPGTGEDQGGNDALAYTYDKDIHSSYYSALFWGLNQEAVELGATQNGTSIAVTSSNSADIEYKIYQSTVSISNGKITSNDTLQSSGTVVSGGTVILPGDGYYKLNLKVSKVEQDFAFGVNVSVPVVNIDTDNSVSFENQLTIDISTTFGAIYYSTDGENYVQGNSLTITETTTVSAVAIENGIASTVVEKLFEKQLGYVDSATGTATDHYLAGRINVTRYNELGALYGYTTPFTMYKLETGEWVTEDEYGGSGGTTCQEYTSTLSEHLSAGRAYQSWGSYYATGSGTYLGYFGTSSVTLAETSAGNFIKGNCP